MNCSIKNAWQMTAVFRQVHGNNGRARKLFRGDVLGLAALFRGKKSERKLVRRLTRGHIIKCFVLQGLVIHKSIE